jgi:serine/threonine-protein kinase
MKACPTCQKLVLDEVKFCPDDGTSLTDVAADSLLGSIVADRYVLLERIGEGNSGVIYRAEHVLLRSKLAVKLLHPSVSKDQSLVDRFREEATTVGQIDSEHIVRVIDFGRAPDGRLFFAMELLAGQTLAALLGQEGKLDEKRARSLLQQIGDALAEAHGIGIVHRDIRPRNIFITRKKNRELVKLLDFGLAKLTSGNSAASTAKGGSTALDPKYISPEQARGETIDARADIYAMGLIAYELVSGAPPFLGGGTFDVLTKHLDATPVPLQERVLELSASYADAVARALTKQASDRIQTVEEFLAALNRPAPSPDVTPPEAARATPSPSLVEHREASSHAASGVAAPALPDHLAVDAASEMEAQARALASAADRWTGSAISVSTQEVSQPALVAQERAHAEAQQKDDVDRSVASSRTTAEMFLVTAEAEAKAAEQQLAGESFTPEQYLVAVSEGLKDAPSAFLPPAEVEAAAASNTVQAAGQPLAVATSEPSAMAVGERAGEPRLDEDTAAVDDPRRTLLYPGLQPDENESGSVKAATATEDQRQGMSGTLLGTGFTVRDVFLAAAEKEAESSARERPAPDRPSDQIAETIRAAAELRPTVDDITGLPVELLVRPAVGAEKSAARSSSVGSDARRRAEQELPHVADKREPRAADQPSARPRSAEPDDLSAFDDRDRHSQSGSWFAEGLAAEQELSGGRPQAGALPAIYDALDDDIAAKPGVSGSKILGIVIGVLVVAVGIVFYFVSGGKDREKKTVQNTEAIAADAMRAVTAVDAAAIDAASPRRSTVGAAPALGRADASAVTQVAADAGNLARQTMPTKAVAPGDPSRRAVDATGPTDDAGKASVRDDELRRQADVEKKRAAEEAEARRKAATEDDARRRKLAADQQAKKRAPDKAKREAAAQAKKAAAQAKKAAAQATARRKRDEARKKQRERLAAARAARKKKASAPASSAKYDPALARFHTKVGRTQLQRGAYTQAKTEFTKAIEFDPKSGDAHGGLGEVSFELGKYAEAARHLRLASAMQPGSVRYLVMLGNVNFKMDLTEEAVALYRKALKKSPDHPAAQRGLRAALRKVAGSN